MKPNICKRIALIPVYMLVCLIEESCGWVGEMLINTERRAMGLRWKMDNWSWGRKGDE